MSRISRGSRGTCASGVGLSVSNICVGIVVGGGRAKSGSDDDVVDLLSSPMTVSGGVGGSCMSLDAACGCGWCSDEEGMGTPAGFCVATLMAERIAIRVDQEDKGVVLKR